MNTPHKHAAILIAIAQGKPVQMRNTVDPEDGEWSEDGDVLCTIASQCSCHEFRIKPEGILINGHEVPKPVREPLEYATQYYAPDTSYSNGNRVSAHQWKSSGYDFQRLTAGMCHLTESAAEKHAQALLSFTKVLK